MRQSFLTIIACLLFSIVQATASERCRDDIFFRRAYLTVTGALPPSQECVKFLNSNDPNKRKALVDRLIKSELGLKYMQMRWGDILRIKSEFPSNLWPNGVQAYNRWIYEQLLNNVPYDKMVVSVDVDGVQGLQLIRFFNAEKAIAQKLLLLMQEPKQVENVDRLIDHPCCHICLPC